MSRDRGFRIEQREKHIKRRIADAEMYPRRYYGQVEHAVVDVEVIDRNGERKVTKKCWGRFLGELAKLRPYAKCSNKNCIACYGSKKERRRKKIENRRVDVAA